MFNIHVTKDIYNKAYVYGESYIKDNIEKDDGLLKTLETQVSFQLKYLVDEGYINRKTLQRTALEIAYQCFNDVCQNLKSITPFLADLKKQYSLGVVSNYNGNIETVLKELTIREFFDVVIDSTIENIYKPDPGIFALALHRLETHPEETVVIGDSYDRDIAPAKKLGCKTIWLKVKSWREFNEESKADYIINTLTDSLQYLNMVSNSNKH
jgi:putative hydrolase of the HAD superfamily